MSSNEMENEIDNEVPAKRMKSDDNKDSPQSGRLLSRILQREIDTEIKLRTDDLETIEENIFLTKQSLLKLRQGVVSDYYKQKYQKDFLHYPPHPAIQDTFIGKSPRAYTKLEDPTPGTSSLSEQSTEIPERKKKSKRKSSLDKKTTPTKELKPPCRIQPKPFSVETVKPSEPRGYISKKQIRIVVGNVSKWLAPEEASCATHKWTVYTKSNDVDLSSFLSKVVFFLHPSYKPNDVIPILGPPFKLTRRGWGEFPLKARFHFKNPLDTPVDVVHVLKLDNKHTGFEAFGAETTLAVWIHIPSKDETESPISEHYVIKEEPDSNTTVRKEEEDQKLIFEETFNNYIKKEKENESHSLNKISTSTEFNQGNNSVIGNFLSNKLDTNFIKEEVLSPEEVVIDTHIIEGNSNLVSYENSAVYNKCTENITDGLDFLIKQEENAELNQLSSSFIEEVIKAGLIFDEFTSNSNEKLCSENNVDQLVVSTGIEDQNNFQNVDNLNIVIKKEPESDEYIEEQVSDPQQNLDDYLDECNVVESEVVIDCDADSPTNYENTEHLEENLSKTTSNISCEDSLNTDEHSLDAKLLQTDIPNNSKNPVIQNKADTPQNKADTPMKIIDISSILKNKNAITLKSGITQIHSLQNFAQEFVQPTVRNYLNTDNSKVNQKVINNSAVGQTFKIITSPEKLVKPTISVENEQLNSFEITDNGKTLATGMVPVVKVADSGSYSKKRKFILRKLNGEVATLFATINPEVFSKTLKLTSSQAAGKNVPNTVFSGVQTLKQNQDNLSNTHTVIKNLGSLSNVGKTQNVSMVPNINLQKNICTSIKNTTQSSSALTPVSEFIKPKRKYNTNKEVKSTVIMLTRENGDVIKKILKTETKCRDIKEEINSSSFKKVSKVPLEGTTLSRNKKGNGKTGALENMSILPYSKCQTNNMNPSLIELQQPMSSKSSFPTHTADFLQGQRKIIKNKRMPQKYMTVLQDSSPLKTHTANEFAHSYNRNFYKNFEASIILKCPTQSTEAAVNWLMKKFPLVDNRAIIPGFRNQHPYCAKSRDEFLSWPYGKQRAAEWTRSKLVIKYLNKLEKIEEKWTTLEVYDWARIRAFTPMKINAEIEAPLLSLPESTFYYKQPTSEIMEFIRKCKDLKENEFVDVVSLDEPTKSTKSGPVSFESSRDKEFKFNLPFVEEDTLFEPDLVGFKKFINTCQRNVGTLSYPEKIAPGIFYSAADRMLISVFHSFAEDLIRRSYNASWIRHDDSAPGVIESEDVKTALLSRKEMDFLLASKEEKKERPPVTLLPNIS